MRSTQFLREVLTEKVIFKVKLKSEELETILNKRNSPFAKVLRQGM